MSSPFGGWRKSSRSHAENGGTCVEARAGRLVTAPDGSNLVVLGRREYALGLGNHPPEPTVAEAIVDSHAPASGAGFDGPVTGPAKLTLENRYAGRGASRLGGLGSLRALSEDADWAAKQAADDVADDSLSGPEWGEYCLSMVGRLLRRRHPGWHTGISQDDLAHAVKGTRRYLGVPATVWAPVTDWSTLARDVVKAGPSAAAVIRIDRPHRGKQRAAHAAVLFQVDAPDRLRREGDGRATRLFLVNPTTPGKHVVTDVTALVSPADHRSGDDADGYEPGELLGDMAGEAARHLMSLSEARALIIDARGRPIAPTATLASTVRALTDPTGRRVAAMGAEGELRQYEIYFPQEIDAKLNSKHDYPLFRSKHLNGITDHSPVDNRYIWILELVTPPSAVHRGDTGRVNRDAVLAKFRTITKLLEKKVSSRNGLPLTELLGEDFTFTEYGRSAMIRRTVSDGPLTLAPQWTVGVPATAIYEFLRYIQTQAPPADRVWGDHHLGTALDIADEYRRLYFSEHVGIPPEELPEVILKAIEYDRSVAAIRGYLALLYIQFAGVVQSSTHHAKDAHNIPKNFVNVASRTSMHGIRRRLPAPARKYLDRHRDEIKQRFSESIKETIGYSGDPLTVKRNDFTVNKFLDHSLSDDWLAKSTTMRAIDQDRVLNIRTNQIEMDDNSGRLSPPLALLEVRRFGPSLISTKKFESIYVDFETVAADLYAQAKQRYPLRMDELDLVRQNTTFIFFISMLQEAWALGALPSQRNKNDFTFTIHDVLPLIDGVIDILRAREKGKPTLNNLRLLARQVDVLSSPDPTHRKPTSSAPEKFQNLISVLATPLTRVSISFATGIKKFPPNRAGELSNFVESVVKAAVSRPLRVHIEGGGDRDRFVSRLWTSELETGLARARGVEHVMRDMVTRRLLQAGLPADRVTLIPSSRGSDASASGGSVPVTATGRRRVIAWIEPHVGHQHAPGPVAASVRGPAGRGFEPDQGGGSAHTARPSYGLARVADPVADRLPLGTTIVVRPDSAYATRRDGHSRDDTLHHLTTTPKTNHTPGPGTPFLFERHLDQGTSSTQPWLSYTVTQDTHQTTINLPDGKQAPDKGWYRHGPLLLHPGHHNTPDTTNNQGWVLFADTGWIGHIDNTRELFTEPTTPRIFTPHNAPRYHITATTTGLHLTPENQHEKTIHLPWQETLPPTGPDPQIQWATSTHSHGLGACVNVAILTESRHRS